MQLAEALDGVDAPVRPDVDLTAEQSANFTYGEEMISNLKLPDWDVIAGQSGRLDRQLERHLLREVSGRRFDILCFFKKGRRRERPCQS